MADRAVDTAAAPTIEDETHAGTEAAGAAHGPDPAALGLDASQWVALAMLIVIAILLWKKVPAAIGRSLDAKISAIRDQLDEAAALRKEAESLRDEYRARTAASEQEAAQLLERARHEADSILAKAEADAAALVERRGRMAEDKIAAEERAAVAELRAAAADAATRAARGLIAERHDAVADKALVDQAIAGIAKG